jgi:hypothetical protein
MIDEVPHRLFRLDILLPADMAITPLHHRIAVEAILFCSFL